VTSQSNSILSGTVSDPNGTVVAGAEVRLRLSDGTSLKATTNDSRTLPI